MLSPYQGSGCPITFSYRVRIDQVITFIYRSRYQTRFWNDRPFTDESKVGQNYNV
jgi:hypothetical protein